MRLIQCIPCILKAQLSHSLITFLAFNQDALWHDLSIIQVKVTCYHLFPSRRCPREMQTGRHSLSNRAHERSRSPPYHRPRTTRPRVADRYVGRRSSPGPYLPHRYTPINVVCPHQELLPGVSPVWHIVPARKSNYCRCSADNSRENKQSAN